MQASGNHEMNHQPEIAFQPDRNSFSDPSYSLDGAPLHRFDRRLHRSQQEGASEPKVLKPLAHNARLQRSQVRGNVR